MGRGGRPAAFYKEPFGLERYGLGSTDFEAGLLLAAGAQSMRKCGVREALMLLREFLPRLSNFVFLTSKDVSKHKKPSWERMNDYTVEAGVK